MSSVDKILTAVMCGTRDKNILFLDLRKLLDVLGFRCRIKGDHFIKRELVKLLIFNRKEIKRRHIKLSRQGALY